MRDRPGVKGAIALSLRGGEVAGLYLEESFSFHVATPEAAAALSPSTMKRGEHARRRRACSIP